MSSYYGLSATTIDFANAGSLTATDSGASVAATTGTETFNYNGFGWLEISHNGGTETLHGSLPTTGNGHGWLLDDTSLEGTTIPAGTWSILFTLLTSAVSATGQLAVNVFKVNTGTVTFTLIGSIMGPASSTIGTAPTAFTLSDLLPQAVFATGEKLYIEILWNQASGGSAANLTSVQVANTSSGVPGASGGLEVQVPSAAPVPVPGVYALSDAPVAVYALADSAVAVYALSDALVATYTLSDSPGE